MFYCCGITDKGTVRKKNEDAFLINRAVKTSGALESTVSDTLIAAVADGVGGEASGEVASKMALRLLSGLKPSPDADYKKKVMSVHAALKKHGRSRGRENMQTTLCALAAESDGSAVMINSGDSRMYLFRGGKIKQLSRDQSLVQMLYDTGCITSEEKLHHARKNVIFPVLGSLAEEPEPQIARIEGGLTHGDIVVMCSDGLSDSLTNGELEDILSQPKRLPGRLADLVQRALDNGSRDNVTVVGVTFLENENIYSRATQKMYRI